MTYNDIKDQWRNWSHRSDLDDGFLDFIMSLVLIRIGEQLFSRLNETYTNIDLELGMAELPEDFKKMRSVHNGRIYLDYVPPKQFASGLGYYSMEAGKLLAGESFVDIVYWSKPKLVGDGSEDKVFNEYPNLYLYQGLTQIGRYLQDPSIIVPNEQEYNALIGHINTAEASQRLGDTPVMR